MELIEKGYQFADMPDGGASLMQSCLIGLEWTRSIDLYGRNKVHDIDTSDSRCLLKVIHILARQGVKWLPADRKEINSARRSLLKMNADYTVEFVWIMAEYGGCNREDVESLLGTPTIRKLIANLQSRVDQILSDFPSIEVAEPLCESQH